MMEAISFYLIAVCYDVRHNLAAHYIVKTTVQNFNVCVLVLYFFEFLEKNNNSQNAFPQCNIYVS